MNRVHELPTKMLEDDDYDKKSYWRSFWKLSTEVTIFEIEKFRFKVRNQCKKKTYMVLNLT